MSYSQALQMYMFSLLAGDEKNNYLLQEMLAYFKFGSKGVFGMTLKPNSKGEPARASQTSQLRSKMLLEL
jgi:hypothetical protein